ncbi:MAG: histone deacetylase [Crenarchaeota archaeon]|nr:histone deacetylase [Thermoproteota archaeon]
MERVLYVGDVFLLHKTPPGHPESPERLKALLNLMKRTKLPDYVEVRSPVKASEEDLFLVHDKEYVEYVKRIIESGGGYLDPDTYASPTSWEPALYAAGTVLHASLKALEGDHWLAFAAVRPPGHHARRSEGRGFCLFNNVAIAAEALRRRGLRVAVVDIDVHWGDGTAYIFYDTDEVLYISTHQDPSTLYPFEGFPYQKGRGKGEGYTVNVPLPPGTGDEGFITAIHEIVLPVLEAYSPQFLLVSAGWDTHWLDPLASLEVTVDGQWEAVSSLVGLAESYGIPVVLALEGGYVNWVVAKSTLNALAAAKEKLFADEKEVKQSIPEDEVEYYLEKVRAELKKYWPL